jgi:hypothetical protein
MCLCSLLYARCNTKVNLKDFSNIFVLVRMFSFHLTDTDYLFQFLMRHMNENDRLREQVINRLPRVRALNWATK